MVTESVVLLGSISLCCLAAGFYLLGRSAGLYCILPEGKQIFLGNFFVWEKNNFFWAKIPRHLLEKSQSVYYMVKLPEEFAEKNYRKELLIETPYGKIAASVQRKMFFRIGLLRQECRDTVRQEKIFFKRIVKMRRKS